MKDKTLNELLTDGVYRFTQSDAPQKIIDEAVQSLFSALIKNAFCSYGDFGKQMDALIKNALPQNLEDLVELPKYNKLIIDEKDDYSISYSKTCHIYFDKEQKNPYSIQQPKSKYKLENNLAGYLTEDTIEQDGFTCPIYKIYSARFEGIQMNKLLKSNCSKFESMMVALYCGTSTLALDCQADDIYYPNHYD